jgi:hypothetical protein
LDADSNTSVVVRQSATFSQHVHLRTGEPKPH